MIGSEEQVQLYSRNSYMVNSNESCGKEEQKIQMVEQSSEGIQRIALKSFKTYITN